MHEIDHKNVIAVETNGRSLLVHYNEKTRDKTKIYTSLNQLQSDWRSNFQLCYKGILINLTFVSDVDEHTVTMSNGMEFPLSRRRKVFIKNALDSLNRNSFENALFSKLKKITIVMEYDDHDTNES